MAMMKNGIAHFHKFFCLFIICLQIKAGCRKPLKVLSIPYVLPVLIPGDRQLQSVQTPAGSSDISVPWIPKHRPALVKRSFSPISRLVYPFDIIQMASMPLQVEDAHRPLPVQVPD